MDGGAILGATLADPWMYVAVIAIGLLAGGLRALFVTGTLRTKSEAEALERRAEAAEKRAENAEAAGRVHSQQVNAALAVLPAIADVMEKFHAAGQQVSAERAEQGDPS